jgi:PAS domain S-box-containing protein
MYTFYCCRPDGAAPTLEAHELASDTAAAEQADRLLEQHASCSHVLVYEGERDVLTTRREAAAGEAPPHPAWPAINAALKVAVRPLKGVAVIVTDPAGVVVFWNQGASKLYRWHAADALGADILEVTPAVQSKRKARAIMATLQAGEPWEGEIVLKRRDGSPFAAYVADTPVGSIAAGEGVIVGVSATADKRSLVWQAQAEILRRLNGDAPA